MCSPATHRLRLALTSKPRTKTLQVSVDFGGLAPFSHNKICALSRSPLTRAVFRSGKTVVDHAANFLVTYDLKEDLKSDGGGGGGGGGGGSHEG